MEQGVVPNLTAEVFAEVTAEITTEIVIEVITKVLIKLASGTELELSCSSSDL